MDCIFDSMDMSCANSVKPTFEMYFNEYYVFKTTRHLDSYYSSGPEFEGIIFVFIWYLNIFIYIYI